MERSTSFTVKSPNEEEPMHDIPPNDEDGNAASGGESIASESRERATHLVNEIIVEISAKTN